MDSWPKNSEQPLIEEAVTTVTVPLFLRAQLEQGTDAAAA